MASTPPSWPSDVISSPVAAGPVDSPWRPPPAAPVPPPAYPTTPLTVPARPGWADVAPAGGLLLLCVGMHIAAMFPSYTGNPPVAVVSTSYETALYVCLTVGWAVAALLVLARVSVRGGVALAGGLAAVELGFLVTESGWRNSDLGSCHFGSLACFRRSEPGRCRRAVRGEHGADGRSPD